ncbi:MAG TPA: tetratricopeptide repeat protein [Candidatus Acidoferrales bacterium]|nr:tetratricopeptide repeat protein [Candidatus Acidoferrales bacterium]
MALVSGWPLEWRQSAGRLAVWHPESADARIEVSLSLPGDMAKSSQIYRFADFEADVRARQLRKHGTKLKLQGQPFEMLLMLLESPGEVITREQMQRKLWPVDTFVDFEHSLNTSVKKIRQALNDSATEPRYIETLPRVGYRFIAPVTAEEESISDLPALPLQASFPVVEGIPGTTAEESSPRHSITWFLGLAFAAVAVAGMVIAFSVTKTRDRLLGMLRPANKSAGLVSSAKKLRRSVAVLPLQNLSADPNQTYFVDGMTDELTTDLAQFGDLRVISRTSAMHYRDGNKTAPEIGKELGVDALVEGSVERVGDRVRIRAQLIDCATDRHLWAQSYDRDMKDVLSMQTEAAREIADQVRGSVGNPQVPEHSAKPAPVNPDAYEAYLKGRYFWNKRTPDGLNKSIGYFNQAIAKDPSFAAAYAGLADSYSILGSDVLPADVANSKARAAASKAIELDPSIAEGHAALALVEFYYDWKWTQSEAEFRRAIELNPNYAPAHQWYSYFLTAMLRFPEAVEQAEVAQQIDPLSLSINTTVATRYHHAGREEDAIQLDRRTLEMDSNFIPAHVSLGAVYEKQGSLQQAIDEYKKVIALRPGDPAALAALGYVYARSGQKDEAHKILSELTETSKQQYVPSFQIATIYAGLDDGDNAMLWLEKSYRQHESQMPFIQSDERFNSLHADARYESLIHRLGFPA